MARYEAPGGLAANQNTTTAGQSNRVETGSSQQNTQQSGTSSNITTGTSTTTGSQSGREVFNIDYLDPTARSALNSLIKALTSGGTPEQRAAIEQRMNEIAANQDIRQQFSQGNAFAQAQDATNFALSQALQQTLPQIAASVDAAGTSGGAFSALLTQQAAQDAAGQAALLGLNQAVAYGQIQTGLSGVLEQLTRTDQDPVVNALLDALNIAKGASESGFRTSQQSSSSTTNSTEVSQGTSQQNQSQQTSGSSVSQENTVNTQIKTPSNQGSTSKITTTNNQNLSTPSATRSQLNPMAQYQKGKTSYSQFGG